MSRRNRQVSLMVLAFACAIVVPAVAQRRGGGGGMRGGGMSRGGARPSVNRGGFSGGGFGGSRPNVAPPRNINPNINRGNIGDVNRGNINRGDLNVNRPINVGDVNVNRDWGWDNRYNGCCYHPVAGAAAVAAGAALATAAIGSVVYSLPSACYVSVVNGITYNQCDGVWYQPQFSGTTTTYIVVNAPQ